MHKYKNIQPNNDNLIIIINIVSDYKNILTWYSNSIIFYLNKPTEIKSEILIKI